MRYIVGGTLICPEGPMQADLRIEDGKIAEIASGLTSQDPAACIDARGCLVFPGFIDAHTHMDMDNGRTVTADDFASGSRAALAGGTTTFVDFSTQDKGGSLRDALAAWHEKARGKTSCDYGFHMAITDWNAAVKAEMPAMAEAGVTSFKLYMAYDALRLEDDAIYDVLKTVKALGGVLGVHCENGRLVNQLSQSLLREGQTGPEAHPRSRPPEVEAEAVNRLLYIARLVDWPVHIVHLSSEAALAEVRAARNRGQTVYVESCPQYLLLDESRYLLPGFEGAKYMMSPPLRSLSDQRALREALRNGEIDTLATDHCSYRFQGQKDLGLGDFTQIPNGAPGIEHRPALVYSNFVHTGLMDAVQMNQLLSEHPAKLFGMYPQKGALLAGSDADIVVWNPDARGHISAKTQYQNTDYTPYEGFETFGRAEWVLLRGQVVTQAGQVRREGAGRFIRRKANRNLPSGI